MEKWLSARFAGNSILAINTIILLMHVLILLGVLPSDFVWGGRLQRGSDLVLFESVSIGMQLLFIVLVAARAGYILQGRFIGAVRIGLWALFGLMVLNTAGNLLSLSSLETIVMTPLTAILAVLLFRLAAWE
ncbi:hypothetical protein [Ectobacillus ponti]|uniref:Uncharacterized protein n=1 Tax=Ectobacillus ponti TaxID=2961894 RepID=A0AA41X5Z0_9BACI|nr:hypothetical protein [Ectobacillus ponti]MCP8969554.1 hypothetical protein [Ectobacillus ponti]